MILYRAAFFLLDKIDGFRREFSLTDTTYAPPIPSLPPTPPLTGTQDPTHVHSPRTRAQLDALRDLLWSSSSNHAHRQHADCPIMVGLAQLDARPYVTPLCLIRLLIIGVISYPRPRNHRRRDASRQGEPPPLSILSLINQSDLR